MLCPAEESVGTIGSETKTKTPENEPISDGSLHINYLKINNLKPVFYISST
jgi:hypothetical protein